MSERISGQTRSSWRGLYKIAAAAALVAVVFFRRNLAAELDLSGGLGIFDMPGGIPVRAEQWFELFQTDRILALFLFNLSDLINILLIGLLFLALYGVFRQEYKSAALVGLIAYMVGMGVYIASNQAFAMMALSDKYIDALGEVPRASYLAAGEALLAIENPGTIYQGTGVYLSLLLVLAAGLIFSFLMLRSGTFNPATGVIGLLANGLALCSFITLAFAPSIQWLFPTISAPFRLAWYIMIALRLFKLSRAS